MTAKPLLRDQAATRDGSMASDALLEVIQILVRDVNRLSARLDAVAAITGPTGGATVDSQSRTAINAIIAAVT
jgi:hypothetical protein